MLCLVCLSSMVVQYCTLLYCTNISVGWCAHHPRSEPEVFPERSTIAHYNIILGVLDYVMYYVLSRPQRPRLMGQRKYAFMYNPRI